MIYIRFSGCTFPAGAQFEDALRTRAPSHALNVSEQLMPWFEAGLIGDRRPALNPAAEVGVEIPIRDCER